MSTHARTHTFEISQSHLLINQRGPWVGRLHCCASSTGMANNLKNTTQDACQGGPAISNHDEMTDSLPSFTHHPPAIPHCLDLPTNQANLTPCQKGDLRTRKKERVRERERGRGREKKKRKDKSDEFATCSFGAAPPFRLLRWCVCNAGIHAAHISLRFMRLVATPRKMGIRPVRFIPGGSSTKSRTGLFLLLFSPPTIIHSCVVLITLVPSSSYYTQLGMYHGVPTIHTSREDIDPPPFFLNFFSFALPCSRQHARHQQIILHRAC